MDELEEKDCGDPTPETNRDERTIYIIGDIDDESFARFVEQLSPLLLSTEDIRVVINSGGGEEPAGYAIHDVIRMCPNRIVAEVYGQAHSMAAAILQAADVRKMAPNSSFMIHNGFILQDLKSQNEVVDLAERIKVESEQYYRILAESSGQPIEVVSEWCAKETYFNAQEAVDHGFADEVMKFTKKRPRGVVRRRKKGKRE